MKFVFSKLFYFLLALGLVPLSLSWTHPWLRWLALGYDVALLVLALVDAWTSQLPPGVRISREFGGRFAVGGETEVRIEVQNNTPRALTLDVKDEYPPQLKLNGLREAKLHVEGQRSIALAYNLTPPKRGRFEFGKIVVRFLSESGFGLA